MARWESLVLNKIYSTQHFTQRWEEAPPLLSIRDVYAEYAQTSVEDSGLFITRVNATLEKTPDSKTIYNLLLELNSYLNQVNFYQKQQRTYLDVLLFSGLSRCKIWPKIFKEFKGKLSNDKSFMNLQDEERKEPPRKNHDLHKLLDWYYGFLQVFKSEVEWKFDKAVLTQKHVKMIEQRQLNKKSNPQFFESLLKGDLAAVKSQIKNQEGGMVSLMECSDPKTLQKIPHVACASGSLELVLYLDEFGCITWNELDGEKQTPIFEAVNSNSLEIIRFLKEQKSVDLDHKECQERIQFNYTSGTPLYLACFLGHMPIIEYLCANGANINQASSLRRTPLTKACYLNHVTVVNWLLARPQIDFMIQDVKGRTALHNAAWGPAGGKDGKRRGDQLLPDSPEAVKLLLKAGHPVDLPDFEGNTALHSATSSKGHESIHLLIASGADRERQNTFGETPMMLAARYGHTEIVRDLAVRYKCSITTPDFKGMTPLTGSIGYGYLETAQQLLEWCLRPDPQLNYKPLLSNQVKFRYQEEQGITISPESRPLIDIEAIVVICRQFKKDESILQVIQWLMQHVDERDTLDKFFIDQSGVSLDHHVAAIIHTQTNSDICLALLGFALRLSRENHDGLTKRIVDQAISTGQLTMLNNIYLTFQPLFAIVNQSQSRLYEAISKQLERNEDDSQIIADLIRQNLQILDGRKNQNLLHLLIRHRKVEIITKILSLKPSVELIEDKDENGLNSLDSAKVLRHYDISHILATYLQQHYSPEMNLQYSIPKYTISVISTNQIMTQKPGFDPLILRETLLSWEPIQKVSFTYIETQDQAQTMADHLGAQQLIGVDVEFYTESPTCTFICTLQFSTPEKSYVLDAFKLGHWIRQGPLKELFSNPAIIKLFHGCDNDLRWLASNFGFQIGGLIDTARAEQIISSTMVSVGLSALAKKYLKIGMDKSFQRADWRIRPIPEIMLTYAREDSEVLIQIFLHQLKLLNEQQYALLYQNCQTLAQKQYERFSIDQTVIELCQ